MPPLVGGELWTRRAPQQGTLHLGPVSNGDPKRRASPDHRYAMWPHPPSCRCAIRGRQAPIRSRGADRDTSFQLQATLDTSFPSIQDIFKEIVVDEARNDLIFDDVLRALEAGRSPVVITERTAHLEFIAKRLERFARHVIVLPGGQSQNHRPDTPARLLAIPPSD